MVRETLKLVGVTQSRQTLDVLYRAHGRDVVNFIRQRACRLDIDPEDVAHEVFAKLAQRKELVEKFRMGTVNQVPYLFSMANNLVADIERKVARQRGHFESFRSCNDASSTDSPESLALADSDLDTFKNVIKELKPSWREAFLLNRFRYLSYPEVAQVMGITVKQVENYIAQALNKLREAQAALEESGEWP